MPILPIGTYLIYDTMAGKSPRALERLVAMLEDQGRPFQFRYADELDRRDALYGTREFPQVRVVMPDGHVFPRPRGRAADVMASVDAGTFSHPRPTYAALATPEARRLRRLRARAPDMIPSNYGADQDQDPLLGFVPDIDTVPEVMEDVRRERRRRRARSTRRRRLRRSLDRKLAREAAGDHGGDGDDDDSGDGSDSSDGGGEVGLLQDLLSEFYYGLR